MYRILQIDGGGIKGIIPIIICEELERIMKATIADTFNMITGSSTGAIIGGLLAHGIPAERVRKMYINDGPRLFTPRPRWKPKNWLKPKYDREPFCTMLRNLLGDKYMIDAETDFMATAFGLCANRTHFIKSWDRKDKLLLSRSVIEWSALSAAHYFGKVCAPWYRWSFEGPSGITGERAGEVFQDGGQGNHNCTLAYCLTEVFARNLDAHGVTILSLGTGDRDRTTKYSDASKTKYLDEIVRFPFQARTESGINQVMAGRYIAAHRQNVRVFRINVTLPAEIDKLDAVDHLGEFVEMAQKVVWGEWFRRAVVPALSVPI